MFDGEQFWESVRKFQQEWQRQFEAGKSIMEVWKGVWDSVEPLDLSGLPRSQFERASIADSIRYTAPDLVILIALNLLFFMFAHISFLRGGVKA